MSLSDIAFIRGYFSNIDTTVNDACLSSMLSNAEFKVRKKIGSETYENAVLILQDETASPADILQAQVYRNVETTYVMYFLIQNANTVVNSQGVVMSNSNQKFGEGTFQIASPKQIQDMKTMFLDTIDELLETNTPATTGVFPSLSGEADEY